MTVSTCMMALTACDTGGEGGAPSESGTVATGQASQSVAACTVEATGVTLPEEVRETSGLAESLRESDLFWTHNDAGHDAELFAIDGEGRLVQRVTIQGAAATDWEDIESGRCDSGSCLFIGDIGDNDAERERITVYRIPEPDAEAVESEPAQALHARYPDGPRDAESLFRLPSGELYLVTKGRRGSVELYRFPSAPFSGETITLERVRELFPEPADDLDRVTAGTASGDGRWVAVRSYRALYLYGADDLVRGGAVEPVIVDLTALGQTQGESVVISDGGRVWMSTEAEDEDARPALGRLRCTLLEG